MFLTFMSNVISVGLLIIGGIACCYTVWSLIVRLIFRKLTHNLTPAETKCLKMWFNIYLVGSIGLTSACAAIVSWIQGVGFTSALTANVASGAGVYYVVLGIFVWWNRLGLKQIDKLPDEVPPEHKVKAKLCLKNMFSRCYVLMPIEMSCQFVVPLLLLFVKREANQLPAWMIIFSSDVSINGDGVGRMFQGIDWLQCPPGTPVGGQYFSYADSVYTGEAYYAPGNHPRSYKARCVWLGRRNRAGYLSMKLGVATPEHETDYEHWGNPNAGRTRVGWALYRFKDHYQLVKAKMGLFGLCQRTHLGYRIWSGYYGRQYASIVNIPHSLIRWKTSDPEQTTVAGGLEALRSHEP